MSYIVLECHIGYAVLLDEEGRVIKAANRNYQVGQTVTDVIEMMPPKRSFFNRKTIYSAAFAAACLAMVVSAVFRMNHQTYASVYMTINPSVRIDLNRKDAVIGVTGVNEDGDRLIEGYSYEKKELETVMDELVDRAIAMEFLHAGGKVTLKLDTEDEQWIVEHSDYLANHVNEYVEENVPLPAETIVIEPSALPEVDYDDTDYGPNNDGITDYEEEDGESDYEED